jgi:NCAIR mutase (PurE)-related protein
MSEFLLDAERTARIGFGEAVYCAGKSVAQIAAILASAPETAMLLTRLDRDRFDGVPVAREVSRTLRFSGHDATEIADVGVAGLWRLMRRVEELRGFPVVIVVAGMDAALPSVVAGLVPGLVVGVPTSVGYGVAAGGRAGLDAMLASCAPGLSVVNIDNGYGAACVALRMLGAMTR